MSTYQSFAAPLHRICMRDLQSALLEKRSITSTRPDVPSSPPHHFSCLLLGAAKGSTAHPKATSRASWKSRMIGRTLLIPDRRGNNRIDGIKNLVEDPRVALIFFVPGANETYRVNGRARES